MDGAVIFSHQPDPAARQSARRVHFLRTGAGGFTLVEVLVVLVVLGVFAGLTTLGIDAVLGRDAEREVERLRKVLELSADRASIRGTPLAIDLLPHGYRFSAQQTNREWSLLFTPRELAERAWVGGLQPISLEVDGQKMEPPWRIIFGSESPEYRLRLAAEGKRYLLSGGITGLVSLSHEDPAVEVQP